MVPVADKYILCRTTGTRTFMRHATTPMAVVMAADMTMTMITVTGITTVDTGTEMGMDTAMVAAAGVTR